jgi:imidazolonepropionase
VVCTLACTQLGLTPEEALAASTVNAAHVLGLSDRGRLAPGLRADLVLLDATDWRHLAYHFAGAVVHTVVSAGRVVHTRA